ncbi:hypothetical protein COCMIDRAFT_25927 [Bipolaris oryzae ATCC 44560]|uniref:Ubiquitin-like domain-containing protein n=1 Tax=Bipolaris oryzae ATCC 44560 TaxID=930090 RepID=W6Z845_COCMI|nr:uncharacterized protein COCMIDRAFT_25927 [Bipolaris oryzae ATCC 44560]EUC45948.1 hypothetical protein COCMIDRAFT_25927 [Bipolaris oryzae ATCC 44560]
MSFGFGTGDFIAVLGLFERIAIEIKNYRDAPAQFQNLSIELDLLQRTLMHVVQTQTDDQEDKQVLERIRAIASHCHQPLQGFIDKLLSKERSLGHYRTARLNDVGIRMKWSMVTQRDIEELRKVVLSEMAAINILLGVQQLNNLKRLTSRSIDSRQSSDTILDKTSKILDLVHNLPDSIANIHLEIARNGEQQARRDTEMAQMVAGLKSQVTEISVQGKNSMEIIRSSKARILREVARLYSVLNDLRKLLHLFSKYSKEILEAISQNTRMLLDIAGHMKRLARAIESVPLHLSVDIIRLDDALGESWGLPFQACQTWESFTDILKVVVYGNQRPGLEYILRGQFQLTLAKTGLSVGQSNPWVSIIRPGAHIKQAMVVPGLPVSKDTCPYPSCTGTLFSQADEVGKICSTCSRLSSSALLHSLPLKLYAEVPFLPTMLESTESQSSIQTRVQKIDSSSIGPIQLCEGSIGMFRRIQVYERPPPLASAEEAYQKLGDDASDFQANLYLGWHALSKGRIDESIHRLERTTATDPKDWIPYYLLARAFLAKDRFVEAYNALQLCANYYYMVPDVWITIGVLYFKLNQYRDSLDAIARSIRLNGYTWESWYNLGVLYDNARNQSGDALDAMQRALDLNPALSNVHIRMEELKSGVRGDKLTEMVEFPSPLYYY